MVPFLVRSRIPPGARATYTPFQLEKASPGTGKRHRPNQKSTKRETRCESGLRENATALPSLPQTLQPFLVHNRIPPGAGATCTPFQLEKAIAGTNISVRIPLPRAPHPRQVRLGTACADTAALPIHAAETPAFPPTDSRFARS
jgi:hypothetical protein